MSTKTKTKTPVKPLRAQILDFLAGRAEATLKQIAAATSERDFPSRVTTELNKMRTDALVECEKKNGKNELWYWLASPSSAVPDSQPAVEQNTGSSAEDASATPASGAAVQPQSAPAAAASLSAATAAADETDGDEMPPADASLLALANRELSDRLARVAHVLRGAGLDALKNLDDGADLQSAAAAVTGAYQMALGDLHAFTAKIADLQHKASMQDADLFKVQHVLGQRIHIGDPGHLAAPVKCAELAAELIDSLLGTNQDNQNLIAIASEKLADVVETGGTDTSDMDLHELAEHAAETIRRMRARGVELDNALHRQDELVRDLRADLANEKALVAKLEHLLQSARNEAEHLRRHADPSAAEAVTLNRALDTLREHIPDDARISLSNACPDISISAFDTTFDVPVQEAADALSHVRALTRYTQISF